MEVEVKDQPTRESSKVGYATQSGGSDAVVREEVPTPIRGASWAATRRIRTITLSILFVGLSVGLWARFAGLGTRQLAVDEYYFVRSVDLILEHGVPKFPTGGYYTRGLLLQYLTAGCVLLLGKSGFAYRFPSLLFSLLSLALLYGYSRRHVGQALAAAVTLTLLLSSWHIEFARFARMYSAFQFTTLLFLVSFDQAFFRQKSRWLLAPQLSAAVATLTHAMGVLLTPILFLPFLLTESRRRLLTDRRSGFLYGLAALGSTLLCVVLAQFSFRYTGVEDPFPQDYVLESSASLRTSAFPFWRVAESDILNLVFVIGTMFLVAGVLWILRERTKVSSVDIFLILLLIATSLHAFPLSFGCLFILVFRYGIHRPSLHARRSHVLLGLSLLAGLGWIAYSLVATEWIGRVDVGNYGLAGALRRTFLGWPDFHKLIYRPWSRELPLLGLLAAGAILYQLSAKLRRPLEELVRNPAVFLGYIALCLGILNSTYSVSRYSFFVYAIILLVIALSVSELVGKCVRRIPSWNRPIVHTSLAFALYLLLFGVTSDFNPGHIAKMNSPEVSYRTGRFARFERTWYGREDYESPARFVNQIVDSGQTNAIVLVNNPPVSYYLRGKHAVYCNRLDRRFRDISRAGGTVELWSNQRLLSTVEELREYAAGLEFVWIIRSVVGKATDFAIEEVWANEPIEVSRVFLSKDERIEVLRVRFG